MKTDQNSNSMRPLDDLTGKIQRAESLLEDTNFNTQLTLLVRSYLSSVKNGEEISPSAWDNIKILASLKPEGKEAKALKEVADIMIGSYDFAAHLTRLPLALNSLDRAFADTLMLMQSSIGTMVSLLELEPGIRGLDDYIKRMLLAEHLLDFSQSLRKHNVHIRQGINEGNHRELEGLSSVICYRAILAGYQAAFLQLQARNFQDDTRSFLLMDFADSYYTRTLENPALPKLFVDQLRGKTLTVLDIKFAGISDFNFSLASRDQFPSAQELHNLHFRFLETMRDYGDLISGSGIPTKYGKHNVVASIDPTKMVGIIERRNSELIETAQITRETSFDLEPQGKLLINMINSTVNAGDLFIKSVYSHSDIELKKINLDIDKHAKKFVEHIDSKDCPVYLQLFLTECCRNKFPRKP